MTSAQHLPGTPTPHTQHSVRIFSDTMSWQGPGSQLHLWSRLAQRARSREPSLRRFPNSLHPLFAMARQTLRSSRSSRRFSHCRPHFPAAAPGRLRSGRQIEGMIFSFMTDSEWEILRACCVTQGTREPKHCGNDQAMCPPTTASWGGPIFWAVS